MASWRSATASTSVATMQEGEEINGGNFMGDLNIESNDRADGVVSSNAGDLLEEIHEDHGNIKDEECALCKRKLCSPRLLSCLHVFCESCLDRQLINDMNNPTGDSIIICSECGQQTIVGPKGAASLPCDYVLTNILDMSAIENMTVICTSCKNQESAVARCSDCAHFLCPNCNTAHQYMRCFENHKVIAFEDLKQSNKIVPIHKPIFCELHPAENMKFYCYTCQELICNECLLVEHKAPEHQYERLSVAESCQINELFSLMTESKSKISECEKVSLQLENTLCELQSQHDHAKSLIIETFQNYETILENCRDNALRHLEKLRSEREFQIMNTFNILGKIKGKIEDANRFTSRLLKHGDTTEILALKRLVSTQLINLINNTPKPKIRPSIEFQTDRSHFNSVINECFGKFKSESEPSVMTSSETITTTAVTSQQTLPMPCPNSSDSSMSTTASSFEGDPFIILPKLNPRNVRPSISRAPFPLDPMHGLQQLAGFTDKVDLNDSIVVEAGSNPSSNTSFAMPDLHSGEFSINCPAYIMNNFHTLQAFRNNSLINQEIPTSNGGENLVLRRASSPVINDRPNLGSLSINTPVNGGFQSLPKQNDHKRESMHIMERIVTNNVAKVPGSEASNYNHPRSSDNKPISMEIRSKFGQLGSGKGQFNSPHGFCLGTDEDIIVADTNNHRIQIFDKSGEFKSMFGYPGKEEGQLWYPRKVAVIKNCGKFVICDRGNERSRMQLFTKNGHFIKKIAIRYIDIVAGLAVTSQGHIVAVDSVSPTVFIISENGSLLKWFDCGDYMREPSDIAISDTEFYVCDFKGHCVVVFNEEGQFLRRIGCENRTNFPNGIDISNAGDVLIGDSHGNRFHVSVYSPEGTLLSEFECPHVKVSRCCGLKITSEGYIITLAKNNHHVLVLNTLYIL